MVKYGYRITRIVDLVPFHLVEDQKVRQFIAAQCARNHDEVGVK